MPKIHMTKGDRTALVEEHSVEAREANGWKKVTAAQAAKVEKQVEPAVKGV